MMAGLGHQPVFNFAIKWRLLIKKPVHRKNIPFLMVRIQYARKPFCVFVICNLQSKRVVIFNKCFIHSPDPKKAKTFKWSFGLMNKSDADISA